MAKYLLKAHTHHGSLQGRKPSRPPVRAKVPLDWTCTKRSKRRAATARTRAARKRSVTSCAKGLSRLAANRRASFSCGVGNGFEFMVVFPWLSMR